MAIVSKSRVAKKNADNKKAPTKKQASKKQDEVVAKPAKAGANPHKEAALKLAEGINKKLGPFSVVTGADTRKLAKVKRLPTGILALDVALGGGLPLGRIIEVFGEESVGKSTLAQYLVTQVQLSPMVDGRPALYLDVEGSIDVDWAESCGIDLDNLLLAQPPTAEDALDMAEAYARSQSVAAIVVDSVAALEPNEELEKTMSESTIGLQARMISKFCRKVNSALTRRATLGEGGELQGSNDTIVLFVNQLRTKIGGFSRPGMPTPTDTTGGKAIKFYASVRIEFKRLDFIKVGDVEVGQVVKFFIRKSKTSKNREVGQFDLYFADCIVDGVSHRKAEIDNTSALIELCVKHSLVNRRGSVYDVELTDGSVTTVKARAGLEELIRGDEGLQDYLKQRLIESTYDSSDDPAPAITDNDEEDE